MRDNPRKQRHDSGPVPPLRALKLRPEAEREWAYGLRDKVTAEEARGEIREKLGISLGTDKAYSMFCQWMWRQTELKEQEAGLEDFESWYAARNPGASREKIREMGIQFFMAQSMKENDPKTFFDMSNLSLAENEGELKVRKEERQREEYKLKREKFEFDAAKACLVKLPELKAIARNQTLDENAKINAVRQKLFGVLPA